MWHPLIAPRKGVSAFISEEGLFFKFPREKLQGYCVSVRAFDVGTSFELMPHDQ